MALDVLTKGSFQPSARSAVTYLTSAVSACRPSVGPSPPCRDWISYEHSGLLHVSSRSPASASYSDKDEVLRLYEKRVELSGGTFTWKPSAS